MKKIDCSHLYRGDSHNLLFRLNATTQIIEDSFREKKIN